ncbi:MAG: hypothetical protein A3I75_07365 [Deltaproteobacteria bacterium RIFCSPLOWO2_02_FULL_50_16]|nr:MAG: hypothetical protein A3I75_07365 [Deltaproteobacteria bacterium RIFCSPLOWO2_02_FULL_50_16]
MNFIFIAANVLLASIFVYLLFKKNLLSFFHNGRWWLTWVAIGTITLMDELTSIFYAPYEAYRFIGIKAIIYIAVTSILIRFVSTRMVEIANILEVNGIKGGGVYSFSYLVLGPNISFIAIASILNVYILTAVISTVSAIENGTSFLGLDPSIKYFLFFGPVWFITYLNINGIKENAKFTFGILIFAAFILLNLILGGISNFDSHSLHTLSESFRDFRLDLTGGSIFHSYSNLIIGMGACILAYSGIESVLQTASLTKSWQEIRKAYVFLALTVGIVTPLLGLFALSSNFDLSTHATDLIPAFASLTMGEFYGITVSILAALTLMLAVNTAMVASGELIEKVAERYNYSWLIKENKSQSLYRIHIINGILYSIIIIVTSGSQAVLAEMYAIGLVASFCINIFSVLIYRYNKGSKELTYKTSRIGTLIIFIILVSIFFYIVSHRLYGTLLWFALTLFFVIVGWRISKKRSPEIPSRMKTNTPMDIIFAMIERGSPEVHLYFKRWREKYNPADYPENHFIVSFYSPVVEMPGNIIPNHFLVALPARTSPMRMIEGILKTIDYEIPPEVKVVLHFGWPSSSWADRFSTGVLVYSIMKLPQKFPRFEYHLENVRGK